VLPWRSDRGLALFPEEVADGVRACDPDAIGKVYTVLADRLLSYLMARVRDREAAEDLLEATFIKLIERGHTIRGGGDVIKAWLFRTAHFTALDYLRGLRRRPEESGADLESVDLEDPARTPEELAVATDTSARVRAHMQLLSDEQQEVLLLRYVAGLSAPETAEVLGKNLSAVKGLQHRGERSLARLMASSSQSPASSGGSGTSQGQVDSA
jgi:RNA polymerase sigma-70 factor, ECF subfamily